MAGGRRRLLDEMWCRNVRSCCFRDLVFPVVGPYVALPPAPPHAAGLQAPMTSRVAVPIFAVLVALAALGYCYLQVDGGAAPPSDPPAQEVSAAEPSPAPPLLSAPAPVRTDRKSTRLNSSHVKISYAVFCLKKKNI